MKVLHIWDIAGVASIIAKYTDRLFGTESLVIKRRALDPYGYVTYGQLWDCGPREFGLRAVLKARGFDIVHVHYIDKIIPYLRFFYPDKPIVLHYHGDDIRGMWSQKRKYWERANAIVCATIGIIDEKTPAHAVLVTNPVDIEIFHLGEEKPRPGTAFHISYGADDLAVKMAEKLGLSLTIHDRARQGAIPYVEMPEVLRGYEYYVDVKRGQSGNVLTGGLSKVGLEALACGLKVITWDKRTLEGLPQENLPESVAKRIFGIYEDLLR